MHFSQEYQKFAGPLAHGVLDPVIIPCLMSLWSVPVPVLNPLDLLWGHWGQLIPKVCSLVAPRWIPVVGRDFFFVLPA